MKRPAPTPRGVDPNEKGGRTPPGPDPSNARSAKGNVTDPSNPSKRDATLADVRRAKARTTGDPKAIPGLALASSLEPLLKLADLTRVLNCQLRTVERLKSLGRLPKPDLLIGTGSRKSPRWKPATIRRWIDEGGAK